MKRAFSLLFGIVACTIGLYVCYSNSIQLQKGSIQADYKKVQATSSLHSRPIHMAAPRTGEILGELDIPSLQLRMPIYEGTSKDELQKGVGHYKRSALPGQQNNCVLSGHNDSVFRHLGELQKGDTLFIETSAGTFTYKITHMHITDENDRTVIVPTDTATLTLTTCYPFQYTGYTSKRYIVSASLIPSSGTGFSYKGP